MEIGIAEAGGRLDELVKGLADGDEEQVTLTCGGEPVAVIVPYRAKPDVSKRVGYFSDRPHDINWEAFDELDDELADDFGA